MNQIKDEQLQIRVSGVEKELIRKHARERGMDISSYVLSKALPEESGELRELVYQASVSIQYPAVLAEINDYLTSLRKGRMKKILPYISLDHLDEFLSNYIAAMIEYACIRKDIAPPEWTRKIPPLRRPWFASNLKSLRLHLLLNSPPPFKARNIFIDSSIGDRV
jgi:hypothetical protein